MSAPDTRAHPHIGGLGPRLRQQLGRILDLAPADAWREHEANIAALEHERIPVRELSYRARIQDLLYLRAISEIDDGSDTP